MPNSIQHSPAQANHNNTLTIAGEVYHLDDHTPMMVQYLTLKAQYPNALLLYRMGDFYELFFTDAQRAADILDITLTRRGKDKSGNTIAMAGVPYHAADSYMARLIAAGETVVICEQVEEDDTSNNQAKNKKGIMNREVVKTLTAGTLTDDALIAPNHTPSVVAIDIQTAPKNKANTSAQYHAGISQLDINAGTIRTQAIASHDEQTLTQQLLNVLVRFDPSEVIISENLDNQWQQWLHKELTCPLIHVAASDFHQAHATQTLCTQFQVQMLEGLGIANNPLMQTSCAALIHYAQQTQQRHVPQVNELVVENTQDYLIIDHISQKNLELFDSVSNTGTSLISVINHCQTAMGKRLLVNQLKRPLRLSPHAKNTPLDTLQQRLDAVEWLHNLSTTHLTQLADILSDIADIERISSRIALGSAKPKDLRRLLDAIISAQHLTDAFITAELNPQASGLLPLLIQQLPPNHQTCDHIAQLIDSAIIENPPAHIRDGGMIAQGFDTEFDRLTHLHHNIQDTLDTLVESERQKTGLTSLKVGYNKVSGFYFELPKGQAKQAPQHFIRQQTLKNSERFMTEALKTLETDYLNAQTDALAREKALYQKLLHTLNEHINSLQRLTSALAQIDVLVNWGTLAKNNHWRRPTLAPNQTGIAIEAGRHLVVESRLNKPNNNSTTSTHQFIANDCYIGDTTHPERLLIITGPNMGGKSTYMRQTALIILLACCGSFVPADRAVIGDIDRIFTRIGSADDLAGGKSTFMVEMIETAQILNLATDKSLVLMDEVGRGTSTTDGLAIAHACVEKLCQIKSLTLFATHYFELTELAKQPEFQDKVRNVHVAASEVEGQLLLLHKINQGAANSSFGLHVAKMAGIPNSVLKQAQNYLNNNSIQPKASYAKSDKAYPQAENTQPQMIETLPEHFAFLEHKTPEQIQQALAVIEKLQNLDPDNLTPKAALEWIYSLKNND
ncbi:DNA mismatch repair protein MutS [Psychrobacter sp. I-STPA6b]|uniref:DNA mismatch repair protein MutS n=1 Tax=Psychrobacter sp. I-STPA6b TaxID=2585718 RepID=UPI001D0C292C|nr:DNA mismatch repair protein MutS [Psychrobacter sp. I-STPA6b]